MTVLGVIPARYGSTRFPGKALASLRGRALVLHVLDRAREARTLDRVLVATDDERIAEVVRAEGGEAVMTSPACASGSDRAAEAARIEGGEIVVNLQGDEPFMHPDVIDAAVQALQASPDCGVGTAAVPIADEHDFLSPHVVKAVVDPEGRALYFSRAPIPSTARMAEADRFAQDFRYGLKHLGLYAFRREVLMAYTSWPPSALERRECLEQLRLLEHGIGIRVAVVEHDSIGIDTPEELERLERCM